jgi:hypothetical protein
LDAAARDARLTLADPDASQREVDQSAADLRTALDAFRKARIHVERRPLRDQIASAQAVLAAASEGEGDGQHPPAAAALLRDAIAAAQGTADDPDATQADIDQAAAGLRAAVGAFASAKVAVDFAALDLAITQAGSLARGHYTDDSWQALQAALQQARDVRVTEHVTQAEADRAASALNVAIGALRSLHPVLEHFSDYKGQGTSTAKVDASHERFVRLEYGGSAVDPAEYIVAAGSTLITLSEAHLKAKPNGTHWYTAVYDDGASAPIRLVVAVPLAGGDQPEPPPPGGAEVLPRTGADSQAAGLVVFALILAGSGVAIRLRTVRRRALSRHAAA